MAGPYDLRSPEELDASLRRTLQRTQRPQSIAGLRKTATGQVLSEARHAFAELLTGAAGVLRPDEKPTFRLGLPGAVEQGLGVARNFVADSFGSASDALHQYAEALPGGKNTPVRMTGNIDSLKVDPRVLDVADATTLGLAGGARVAKGVALGLKDAGEGMLEDIARGGMANILSGARPPRGSTSTPSTRGGRPAPRA
jgi:hypothetical protein